MTTNQWRGDAQPLPQIEHLTPANLSIGDILTVTINRKDCSFEVPVGAENDGDTGYISAAVEGLVEALNNLGQTVPEFAEVTWTVGTTSFNGTPKATHVIATGPSDGKPVTISLSTTNATDMPVTVSTLVAGRAGQNEIQRIVLAGPPTGGTFTLTFATQTTGTIAYNASAATVQTALEALSNIAPGDVTVTGDDGGPWSVEFTGTYAATNVPLMTANGGSLTGGTSITIRTLQEGSGTGTNELHTIEFEYDNTALHSSQVSDTNLGTSATITFSQGQTQAQKRTAVANAFDAVYGVGNTVVIWVSDTSGSDTFTVEWTGAYAGVDIDALAFTEINGTVDDETTTEGSGTATSEIQEVTIHGEPTGGTFTLTLSGYSATAAIAYNASAAAVESAIEAMTGGSAPAVSVTKVGWVYTITFTNPSGNIAQMTASSSLTGGGVTISTTQNAAAGVNETQTVSLGSGTAAGTFTLTFDGQTTGTIAYNASAATVQTALEALSNIAPGDVVVIGDAGGPWTIEFDGSYAATNVSLLIGDGASLSGSNAQTFTSSTEQSPTGPNWFDVAENWSLNHIPADNEDLLFADSSVSCLYGMNYASITPATIKVKASYTGHIGLPKVTETGYFEYRNTELVLGTNGDGSASTVSVEIGEGEGPGSGLIRINTGTKQTVFTQFLSAASDEGNAPAVVWRGTHASNTVTVYQGSFGAGYFSGEPATIATLAISYVSNVDTDANVFLGSAVTSGDVIKAGGVLNVNCAATFIRNEAGDTTIGGSGVISKLFVNGGLVVSNTSGLIGKAGTITGITQANPAVVTSASHGLSTGDKIRIASVVGMTEVNQREFTILVVNANSFQLIGENSSAYTAYSSGGVWGKIGTVLVSGEGILDFSRSLTARQVAVAIDVYGDQSLVRDNAKKVTTYTYLSGEFARHFHYTSREDGIGRDYIDVRRDA